LATDLDGHFRQLVILYQQRLYSFALRLAGSPQDAEDIVLETFLRSYHALKSYPVLRVRALRIRQWLYTVTLNIFRNRQRKPEHQSIPLDTTEESPLLEIEDPSCGPDEEAYWHEMRRELEMRLASLAERYRVAVTLYALRQLHKALDTQTNGVR
jgi:RNA polymerase sigma-70 factor, ECF subfamily